MASIRRNVLSLTKGQNTLEDIEEQRPVQVGIFDVLLPCRQFTVRHKVAELGQVSLTTEFLLRLLFSVDGIDEYQVASFFGFNATEMAFVINEAESRSYVERRSGRVWLTDAAYTLFQDGDRPQIYEVSKRTERVGFDLISMAPCDRESLSDFERSLPELEIKDGDLVSAASQVVPDSFRKFYSELVGRKERDSSVGVKRSLYSVDEVIAEDRFPTVVPVLAVSNSRKPGDPEPMLDAWRSGHELEDRSSVLNAVASFLENMKTVRRSEDANAYQVLLDLAPDFLKDFTRRDGLSVDRFFKETISRAGELRADRKTIGIVGPLSAPDNSKRVLDALEYTSELKNIKNDFLLWVVPMSALWGATRTLETLIDKVVNENEGANLSGPRKSRKTLAITCGKPSRHIEKAFDTVLLRANNGSVPAALEMLLIPGRLIAVTVHSPIGPGRGYPVALGILSFDSAIVSRAHAFLEAQLPRNMEVKGSSSLFDLFEVTRPVSDQEFSSGLSDKELSDS